MKKRYTFTVDHKDGSRTVGFADAEFATHAEGYAQLVAMRQGWKQEDITVNVEEAGPAPGYEREWLETRQAWAAYDAANGYDLDDEGFSLHDYS